VFFHEAKKCYFRYKEFIAAHQDEVQEIAKKYHPEGETKDDDFEYWDKDTCGRYDDEVSITHYRRELLTLAVIDSVEQECKEHVSQGETEYANVNVRETVLRLVNEDVSLSGMGEKHCGNKIMCEVNKYMRRAKGRWEKWAKEDRWRLGDIGNKRHQEALIFDEVYRKINENFTTMHNRRRKYPAAYEAALQNLRHVLGLDPLTVLELEHVYAEAIESQKQTNNTEESQPSKPVKERGMDGENAAKFKNDEQRLEQQTKEILRELDRNVAYGGSMPHVVIDGVGKPVDTVIESSDKTWLEKFEICKNARAVSRGENVNNKRKKKKETVIDCPELLIRQGYTIEESDNRRYISDNFGFDWDEEVSKSGTEENDESENESEDRRKDERNNERGNESEENKEITPTEEDIVGEHTEPILDTPAIEQQVITQPSIQTSQEAVVPKPRDNGNTIDIYGRMSQSYVDKLMSVEDPESVYYLNVNGVWVSPVDYFNMPDIPFIKKTAELSKAVINFEKGLTIDTAKPLRELYNSGLVVKAVVAEQIAESVIEPACEQISEQAAVEQYSSATYDTAMLVKEKVDWFVTNVEEGQMPVIKTELGRMTPEQISHSSLSVSVQWDMLQVLEKFLATGEKPDGCDIRYYAELEYLDEKVEQEIQRQKEEEQKTRDEEQKQKNNEEGATIIASAKQKLDEWNSSDIVPDWFIRERLHPKIMEVLRRPKDEVPYVVNRSADCVVRWLSPTECLDLPLKPEEVWDLLDEMQKYAETKEKKEGSKYYILCRKDIDPQYFVNEDPAWLAGEVVLSTGEVLTADMADNVTDTEIPGQKEIDEARAEIAALDKKRLEENDFTEDNRIKSCAALNKYSAAWKQKLDWLVKLRNTPKHIQTEDERKTMNFALETIRETDCLVREMEKSTDVLLDYYRKITAFGKPAHAPYTESEIKRRVREVCPSANVDKMEASEIIEKLLPMYGKYPSNVDMIEYIRRERPDIMAYIKDWNMWCNIPYLMQSMENGMFTWVLQGVYSYVAYGVIWEGDVLPLRRKSAVTPNLVAGSGHPFAVKEIEWGLTPQQQEAQLKKQLSQKIWNLYNVADFDRHPYMLLSNGLWVWIGWAFDYITAPLSEKEKWITDCENYVASGALGVSVRVNTKGDLKKQGYFPMNGVYTIYTIDEQFRYGDGKIELRFGTTEGSAAMEYVRKMIFGV